MRLTDAGLETVLLFDEGIDLPHFAAFPLVDSEDGRAAMGRYYTPFIELARDRNVPLVLSAPTWRANADWGRLLGYEGDELAAVDGARSSANKNTAAPNPHNTRTHPFTRSRLM